MMGSEYLVQLTHWIIGLVTFAGVLAVVVAVIMSIAFVAFWIYTAFCKFFDIDTEV